MTHFCEYRPLVAWSDCFATTVYFVAPTTPPDGKHARRLSSAGLGEFNDHENGCSRAHKAPRSPGREKNWGLRRPNENLHQLRMKHLTASRSWARSGASD